MIYSPSLGVIEADQKAHGPMVREFSDTGAVETNQAMAKTKQIKLRNAAKRDNQSRRSEDDWEITPQQLQLIPDLALKGLWTKVPVPLLR